MKTCIFALVLLSFPVSVPAQAPVTTTPGPRTLPPQVVYGQLFKHLLFLEKQADLADQRGLNGNELRNFYQEQANLSPAEAALLKQLARDAASQVQAIDDNIQAAIARLRSQFPGGKVPAKSALPPPPQELQDLQNQRDNVIIGQFTALRSALGADRFQNLDNYVQTVFAPHIKIAPVAPPPFNPSASRPQIPAFPPQQ